LPEFIEDAVDAVVAKRDDDHLHALGRPCLIRAVARASGVLATKQSSAASYFR
jgi:hypothetical protein